MLNLPGEVSVEYQLYAQRGWGLNSYGFVSLMMAVALPVWLLMAGVNGYPERLGSYHIWLGGASVVHLICAAWWVLASERIN